MTTATTTPMTLTPAQRMAQALQQVSDMGLAPVVLLGAGRHTAKILPALYASSVKIVAFADESPERQRAGLLGWKVVGPGDIPSTGAKSVILNSDAHEQQMWRRREELEAHGITVIRLYPEYDEPALSTVGASTAEVEAAMNQPVPLDREALHRYWSSRGEPDADDTNSPEAYAQGLLGRSVLLAEWVEAAGVALDAPILELGCNLGRNLAMLHHRGYRNLSGVEINEHSLQAMKRWYPETASMVRTHLGDLETVLPTMPDEAYELVFTMRVLGHIHLESEEVFDQIVRIARRLVLTIESEHTSGARHFQRNYGDVFGARGCREVRTLHVADAGNETVALFNLDRTYVIRLFETPGASQ